jgi:hypothetical protein
MIRSRRRDDALEVLRRQLDAYEATITRLNDSAEVKTDVE